MKKNYRSTLLTILMAAVCLLFPIFEADAANLAVNSPSENIEQEVTVSISVNNAPNDVYVFGFDIIYDPQLLEYKSNSFAGMLTENFTFKAVNPISSNTLRIGGMDTGDNIIHQNATGNLVSLTFKVVGLGSNDLTIGNLIDDMGGWTTTNGMFTAKDAYEPDNLHPQAGVIDAVQRHYFHEAGDADWGMIYGTAGKSYIVSTTNLEANCDTVLELYSIDGQTLLMSRNENGAGSDESISWNCTQDTVYFIKIKDSNSRTFGSGTAYDLSVEYPADFDAYEPDNTYQNARKVIVDFRPQHHNFLTQGDEDWVKFQTVAGESYKIEASNTGNNCDMVIELYGSGGRGMRQRAGRSEPLTLIKTENSTGVGENEVMQWVSPENGTYYARTINANGLYGEGTNYDLAVERSAIKFPGMISGSVINNSNKEPIQDAIVSVNCSIGSDCNPLLLEDITMKEGDYCLNILSGSYVLSSSKPGYLTSAFIIKDNNGNIIDQHDNISGYKVEFIKDNQFFSIDIEMKECLGDTNGDLEITSADALIAFDTYLLKRPTTYGFDPDRVCCDVNKDGKCTSGDAYCIFVKYMGRTDLERCPGF